MFDRFLCLVLMTSGVLSAGNADSVRRALEQRYQHARTLKAAFFERYNDGNGRVTAESGTVYFSRPGRMRWDYESPEQKLFLVDGTNVWFYVPADRTASRAKLNESSDWRTPLALLTGKADLTHLCSKIEITEGGSRKENNPSASPSPGNTLLSCKPRTNSAADSGILREVLFEADSSARLVRVVIREAGNVETEFRFGNWEENVPIPEITFHFAPPPGVAIVDEATLAGAAH